MIFVLLFWKHFCSHSDKHNGCLNKPELVVKASDRGTTNNIQVNNDSLPFFLLFFSFFYFNFRIRIFQANIFTVYTKQVSLFFGWYIPRDSSLALTHTLLQPMVLHWSRMDASSLCPNSSRNLITKKKLETLYKYPPWAPLDHANRPSTGGSVRYFIPKACLTTEKKLIHIREEPPQETASFRNLSFFLSFF